MDYEPQLIEDDAHDSDSEIEPDLADADGDFEEMESEDTNFYIGKDGETLWADKPVASLSKTKSKNI